MIGAAAWGEAGWGGSDAGHAPPGRHALGRGVSARPRPAGTKEVSVGVDEQGDIYLSFDCPEMTDASRFTWCKSYEELADDEKFRVETVGDQ